MTLSAVPEPETAGSPKTTSYAVCRADLGSDRAAVLEIWRLHMLLSPERKYDWFYLDHPFGSQVLLLLTHGPQATRVGVAGLGTRQICVLGEYRTSGILADLVVRPEHRTLYPALLLQRHLLRVALGLHTVVYGMPNRYSTPIVRRLGYTNVGNVIRYAGVLRHRIYLERLLPRWLSAVLGAVADRVVPLYFRPHALLHSAQWECTWLTTVDDRFDALWERAGKFDGLIGVRDAKFLAWRFMSQPGCRYRVFSVARRGDATIIAYAVCEVTGSALRVRDFLIDPSRTAHLRLLVHLLSRAAFREGLSSVTLEFLGPAGLRASLTGAGLRERAVRALYASFGPQDAKRLRELDWYVTSADEDGI